MFPKTFASKIPESAKPQPMSHSRTTRFQLPLGLMMAVCLVGGLPAAVLAGGGPENVLLVVNRKSPTSLTIANHYIRLRHIPAGNVLTLPWDPAKDTTDIDTFRKQILSPVLTAIQKRRLRRQIDYVVYSSDFPWGIDLSSDINKFLAPGGKADLSALGKPPWQPPKGQKAMGSINGLTYLWQPVMGGNGAYLILTSNQYFRRASPQPANPASLGFRSIHRFGPDGELLDSGGRQYLLSMMLGVTAGRGNSLAEVLSYLDRSATADGTHPPGTIYYVENKDIRSRIRQSAYPAAVELLKRLGVAAEIIQGTVPVRKDDVQGAMMGVAHFSWKDSGSTILPGAICEHFTSFGGVMRAGAAQTPLSELLRYGAAGASGTVVEPYSIPHKFPSAMIQVHYARGCTLAEAFYQSVFGPYQLLIVGDPLCRPWANIPQVIVEGAKSGATVTGKLTLKPSAQIPGGSKVDHFELFIDGWRRAICGPGEPLPFDTALLADGYHELRVVAVEAGPIESQGRWISSITTANHGRKITASVTAGHPEPPAVSSQQSGFRGQKPGRSGQESGVRSQHSAFSTAKRVRPGEPLCVTADSPGSTSIAVLHNSRLLGKITGGHGQLEIDPVKLGFGPVELRVVGLGESGSTSYAWAEPIELVVEGSP
jgi:hypothetical protein